MSDRIREGASKTFHIGKLDAKGNATFVFNLRRREDGGISLSKVKIAPTDTERAHLFAHFGRPIRARVGGLRDGMFWEGVEQREPGTPEHFLAAVHSLPDPFVLLASEH